MRIAHVTQATAMGGLRRVIETLGQVQRIRHEVLFVAPTVPTSHDLERDWQSAKLEGNLDIGGHFRLMRLLDRWHPDVVFLHAGSPGEMALATALVGTIAPCVVVEHAPHHYPLRRWPDGVLFPRMKRRAARWVAVSHSGAHALETLWRLEAGSINVISNGIARPPDDPPEDTIVHVIKKGPFVLGLGRPTNEKGFDVFLGAATAAATDALSVQWIWMGADARSRQGPVQLLPWDKHAGWLLRRCEALVVPSRVEAFGLVVLEAWACETPVVATRVGGLSDLVRHRNTGLLVDDGDAPGVAAAVAELSADQTLRSTLVRDALQEWQTTYTAEAMAEQYEALIKEILGR